MIQTSKTTVFFKVNRNTQHSLYLQPLMVSLFTEISIFQILSHLPNQEFNKKKVYNLIYMMKNSVKC